MTFLAGIFTTVLLAQAVEQVEPATQPTLIQLRAQQATEMEREISEMPRRGKIEVSKLLSFQLVNDDIAVKPLIEPTEAKVYYEPINWPGWFEISVGTPESSHINFQHISLISETGSESRAYVITASDYLQIGRDTDSDTETLEISLIQNKMQADDLEENITFRVNKNFNTEGIPPYNLTLSASNFSQLRRRHPREIRTYLGPILQDLRAEHLLQDNDIQVAWQVLGPEIEPDLKLSAKLKSIVEKLSSDDFSIRAKTEDELAALGPPAASALSRWDLSTLPADPRTSIESFIRSQQKIGMQQVNVLRNNPDFLLDLLSTDDPAILKAAQSRIGELTGKTISLPANLTPEQKLLKIEELRQSLSPTTQP